MNEKQGATTVIAWRRRIRRRIACTVIAVSSALLVGLALWVYVIDPWCEAKSEFSLRSPYLEKQESKAEIAARHGMADY